MTITIVLLLIIITYSALIFSYSFFFKKISIFKKEAMNTAIIKVSIIIPARNESHCITDLLYAIKNQDYPAQFVEIIVVDDASTDDTYAVVESFITHYSEINCKVLKIENDSINPTYKKYAISQAVRISKGDLIITTDADCMVGSGWVSGIVSKYQSTKAKMLVGLVAYHNDNNAFQKIQHLEFLSLIASGAAAVASGFPIMCNGANLVYERKAFDAVNGFDANEQFASGDDVFLLLKIKKYFGRQSISILNDKETIVYTQAKQTLSGFIHQRIRWASKTKGYKDAAILLVAGIVFALNAAIIFTFFAGIFCHELLLYSLGLFIIKVIVDFPIMLSITGFVNRRDLLVYYLPLQIVYLPYVLIIGIVSNFVSYSWKGRRVKG